MSVRPPRLKRPWDPPRRLEVGSVLGRTFSIWSRNIAPFSALAILAHLPLLACAIVFSAWDVDGASLATYMTVQGWGSNLLGLVASAAIMYGVAQDLNGQRVKTRETIERGLPRVLGAVGVGVLVFLCEYGPTILNARWTAAADDVRAKAGLGLMGFALTILGMFVGVVLGVAVPVRVVESPGVWASLPRSAQLTSGHRWSVLWITLLIGLIGAAAWAALTLTLLPGFFSLSKQPIWERVVAASTPTSIRVYLIASVLLSAVAASLTSVASAVMYHDLRLAKDGVTAEDLARVFE